MYGGEFDWGGRLLKSNGGVCKVDSHWNATRIVQGMLNICLTVREASQAGTEVDHTEPEFSCGRGFAQRIKGTPGITG